MRERPLVSILLPTYNRASFLPRAIESVLAQKFNSWELIIISDVSPDNTDEVIDNFLRKDSRIKAVRNLESKFATNGISYSLKQGMDIAQGKYIARLDDDDYWIDDEKLKKQIEFFESHPDYVITGGGMVVFDTSGNERFRYLKNETDEMIRANALFANPFSHTTVMFRADIAKQLRGYQTQFIEDWDLWLRMGKYGKFYNFPLYFAAYTLTYENNSFIHQRSQNKAILRLICQHKEEYPNFKRAFLFNLVQYWYSFLPIPVRKNFHSILLALKHRTV